MSVRCCFISQDSSTAGSPEQGASLPVATRLQVAPELAAEGYNPPSLSSSTALSASSESYTGTSLDSAASRIVSSLQDVAAPVSNAGSSSLIPRSGASVGSAVFSQPCSPPNLPSTTQSQVPPTATCKKIVWFEVYLFGTHFT